MGNSVIQAVNSLVFYSLDYKGNQQFVLISGYILTLFCLSFCISKLISSKLRPEVIDANETINTVQKHKRFTEYRAMAFSSILDSHLQFLFE